MGEDIGAKVAGNRAAKEARDLDQDRLIQAHFHTKGFTQFWSGERP